MGSMSEEMKKVVARWNEPTQEETVSGAQEAPLEPQFKTIRAEILHMIQTNPGITGVRIKDTMCLKHANQTEGAISSQISSLFKDFYVRREHALHEGNRSTFAYFANSLEEAKKMRVARRKRVKILQDRLEKAREVKAQKARQRQEERERIQMPLPFDTPTPAPTPLPPAALDLRHCTAMDILNAVNFTQAKELYAELKGAFGG